MSWPVALVFGAAAAVSLWAAPGLEGLAGAILAGLMLAIAISDWRRFRVPDPLTASAVALRGLALLVSPQTAFVEAALDALARGLAAFAAFYLFRAVYGWARGREGLGFGDVKLAGVAGLWVDGRLLPWVVEAAAIFGLGLAFARRRGAHADMRLPFAVGFAPAIWLGWWLERLGF